MLFVERLSAPVALAVALSASPAFAAPEGGNCSPTQVKYIASTSGFFRTTSTDYVNLAQARVVFRQGGKAPSCVLVRFSAAPKANRNMGFRALLDGAAALPFEGQISDGVDKGPNARRFTFIFPNVAPGPHALQMQYQMTSQGGFVDMNAHNTIVWFAR